MNCYLVLCFVTLAYGADPICNLPPDSGPCLALFPKYYYDPKSCGCKPFTYGGCGGNENRFETKEECEQRCGVDPICNLEPVVGPCKAYIPRYYYDPESCGCKPFTYGGCGGNENRFGTQEECEQRCGG